MKLRTRHSLLVAALALGCAAPEEPATTNLFSLISEQPAIEGKSQYLASPFVTAGDRVYLIGHQDGSFPDLGWHVTGEMGGIWDHPIKLMDGFMVRLTNDASNNSYCLDKADKFINYPMANRHEFSWPEENLKAERIQFVPDGMEGLVFEYRISNQSKEDKKLTFDFTALADLRPTWLGERTEMIDAQDEARFDETLAAVVVKDQKNPWYTMFGSSLKGANKKESALCDTLERKGMGTNTTLSYSLSIKSGEEVVVPVFIAGSYQSEEALKATYEILKSQSEQRLSEKINRYKQVAATSQLTIPDQNIAQMYEWLKYNVEWLTRNVPEQGVGLSAGLPDYPWWFGADATYALQGVLASGEHELAKNTILLLHKISQRTNSNGRIIHEVSTNGAVYNPGNVNETAQFITLVNTYYNWTGDKELVLQLFPDAKKGMDWLLKERDPDGNHYPNGSGMMEIPGLESELEMIDVAVYTQQALASAAQLATVAGENDLAASYQKLAEEQRLKINRDWWQASENSFGDFRGTVEEAMPILKAAIIRTDTLGKTWAVAELKNTEKLMKKYPKSETVPHVIYHNWVVNTPMETGVADADKAMLALEKAKRYQNPFGMFVTGIDRTEEPDSVVLKSRKKTFSYTGAVMTLPTGVQAVGAARYGKADEALEYIKKLNQSFSYALPGSMYEVSPDFGMITQAWNIYGVAVPVVNYFFGTEPHAGEKSISVSPKLPSTWKNVSIDNVMIGNNSFSVAIVVNSEYKEYRVKQTQADWSVNIDIRNAKKVLLNDKVVDAKTLASGVLTLRGKENSVKIF